MRPSGRCIAVLSLDPWDRKRDKFLILRRRLQRRHTPDSGVMGMERELWDPLKCTGRHIAVFGRGGERWHSDVPAVGVVESPKTLSLFFVPPEGQKFIMVHIYVGIRGSRRPPRSLSARPAGGEATARRRLPSLRRPSLRPALDANALTYCPSHRACISRLALEFNMSNVEVHNIMPSFTSNKMIAHPTVARSLFLECCGPQKAGYV